MPESGIAVVDELTLTAGTPRDASYHRTFGMELTKCLERCHRMAGLTRNCYILVMNVASRIEEP